MSRKASRRPRTEQRERARTAERLGKKLDRLAANSPGGSPERAWVVSSAAMIEIRARGQRCARCDGPLDLQAHEAEFVSGQQLRRVDLLCRHCFAPRRLWFALGPAMN